MCEIGLSSLVSHVIYKHGVQDSVGVVLDLRQGTPRPGSVGGGQAERLKVVRRTICVSVLLSTRLYDASNENLLRRDMFEEVNCGACSQSCGATEGRPENQLRLGFALDEA